MSAVTQVRKNLFETCCRLCLGTSNDRTLIDVFTVNNLSTIIRDMFNINVTPTDKCTTSICAKCLGDSYDFSRRNNTYLQDKSRVLKNYALLNCKSVKKHGTPSTSKSTGCVDIPTTVKDISPIADHACNMQESQATSKSLAHCVKNGNSSNDIVRTDHSNSSSKTKKPTSELPGSKQSSKQGIQKPTQSSKNAETMERSSSALGNQRSPILAKKQAVFRKKANNNANRKRKHFNGSDESENRTKVAKARKKTVAESISGTQLKATEHDYPSARVNEGTRETFPRDTGETVSNNDSSITHEPRQSSKNSASFCVQSSGSGPQQDSSKVIPKFKIVRVVGTDRIPAQHKKVDNNMNTINGVVAAKHTLSSSAKEYFASSPSVENFSSVAKDMTSSESLSEHSTDNTREQNEAAGPCAGSLDDGDCDVVMVESQSSITKSPAVGIPHRRHSTYGIRVCRDLFDAPQENVEFAAIRNDLMIRKPLAVDDNFAVPNNEANSCPGPSTIHQHDCTTVRPPRRESICFGIDNQPTLMPNNVPRQSRDPTSLYAVPVESSQMAVNAGAGSVGTAPHQEASAFGTSSSIALATQPRQPPPTYQVYSRDGELLHLPNYQLRQTGVYTFAIQPSSTRTPGRPYSSGRVVPPAAFNQRDPRFRWLQNS